MVPELFGESMTSTLRKGVGDIIVVLSLFLFGGYIMTEDDPSPLAPFVGQWTAHLTSDSGDAVIRWTLTTNLLGRGLQSSMVYESRGVVSHEINAIWFYSPESDSLIVQQLAQVRQFERENGDSRFQWAISSKSLHYILCCISSRSGGLRSSRSSRIARCFSGFITHRSRS